MQIGLIGLPQVGKTTLFELMTGLRDRSSVGKASVGMARVPDTRIDKLSAMYKPKKTTYAQIEVVDIPGLIPSSDKGASGFLAAVRDADALIHVVRAFDSEEVPHVEGSINPVRDLELVEYELLLADLDLVEKRIQRIKDGKKVKPEQAQELELLAKIKDGLENEKRLSELGISDAEWQTLTAYQFLTDKPMVLAINVSEDALNDYPGREELQAYTAARNIPMVEISARIEAELAELSTEEREVFMQDLGINEPGMDRIMRTLYHRLGLISFFTVGEDEVRAWTINQGTNARKAAGKIHSDLERGFIRAEVVGSSDLLRLGSMGKARDEGLVRLEGKEFIVQDGDIMHVRFNV
ncbi:MAG: redox-regulated ATPase YchF [Methylocystaceae bacterium]